MNFKELIDEIKVDIIKLKKRIALNEELIKKIEKELEK